MKERYHWGLLGLGCLGFTYFIKAVVDQQELEAQGKFK